MPILGRGTADANFYGTSSFPLSSIIPINLGKKAISIAANDYVACAVLDDGQAKCWGDNTYGVIGQGTATSFYADPTVVTELNMGAGQFIRSMAVSNESVCAILGDGHLKCWGLTTRLGMGTAGSGNFMRYGDQAGELGDVLPRVDIGNSSKVDVMKITAGFEHTCALMYNGRMKCWGSNAYGRIGLNAVGGSRGMYPGEMGDNLLYLDLGAPNFIKDIEAGGHGTNHTCALMINGDLKCFGRNDFGQLGYGHTNSLGDGADEVSPTLGAINFYGPKIRSVAVAYGFTCGLTVDGEIYCFGDNNSGQQGVETATNSSTPNSPVMGMTGVIQIATGLNHACAILGDGKVKCWGDNSQGQLGINSTTNYGATSTSMGSLPYVDLGTVERAIKITAGENSTCALLQNRNVKCWGRNNHGQIGLDASTAETFGDGSPTVLSSQPVVLFESTQALSVATDIIMGGESACALKPDGLVKCWGKNIEGALGQNTNTPLMGDGSNMMNTIINAVLPGIPTEKLTVGTHVCRIDAQGKALCWGSNSSGQAGQGANAAFYGGTVDNVPTTVIDL